MKRFASIDLGSNTVRLLVGEQPPDSDLAILREERRIIRLGEGLHKEKRLLDHRIQLAIDTLNEFRQICSEYGEVFIYAAATSAVRDASNRDEFVQKVKLEAGMTLHVIPWQEEAALTLDGVLWKLSPGDDPFVTFDIGGGSTEYIMSRGREVLASCGTKLGVVRLTERFITAHPSDPKEHQALSQFLSEELGKVQQQLGNPPSGKLIGTAGTVTTLAALDLNIFPYDEEKIHGSTLSINRVGELLEDLKAMTLEERVQLQPLEKGREDLIIAGATVALETMRAFECDTLTVSEYALREGLLLRAQAMAASQNS